MRTKGRITSWNDDKGYGFITPFEGGKQLFVHVNALSNRNRRPQVNDVITYSIAKDKQGRPCAANATLAGDKLVPKSARQGNSLLIILSLLFLGAVGVSVVTGKLAAFVLYGYLALSMITYIAYAIDKSAARRGKWRTSESTLLLLGLAGGWPGGLLAQEKLRHKSKKTSFRTAFWATVLLNCGALVWLHTAAGHNALQGLLV